MRKLPILLGLVIVITTILVVILSGTCSEDRTLGPNPDAGDGISDGSSLDAPNKR